MTGATCDVDHTAAIPTTWTMRVECSSDVGEDLPGHDFSGVVSSLPIVRAALERGAQSVPTNTCRPAMVWSSCGAPIAGPEVLLPKQDM